MGAPSRKNIRTEVFTALANNPNCEYSLEQLEDFFSQTSGAEKTTSKRRTSAFDMWKKLSKEEKEDLKWTEYKTKYPDKIEEFQTQADEYNKEHFEEKPKSVKKKNNNDELKKEIAKLKNKDSSEKDSSVTITEPIETITESSSSEKTDTFDKIDTNNDGVISREEYEKYVNENEDKSEEHEDKSEENEDKSEDSEEHEEHEDKSEEREESEMTNNVNLPVFKGKDTALNNYKEWKKDELGVDPTKSIPGSDLKEYKDEDGFDPKEYDDSKPWFEYIKNNRQTD